MPEKKIVNPLNSCFKDFKLSWDNQKEEYDVLYDKALNAFRVGVIRREK